MGLNYAFVGWTSVVLLGLLVLPFLLSRINQYVFKPQSKGLRSFIKFLRKLHKPLGILFVIIAFVHGWLALGAFRLHTGWALYISLLLTVIFGGSFYRLKKKKLFVLHKVFAGVTVLLFLLHFFKPYAFSML